MSPLQPSCPALPGGRPGQTLILIAVCVIGIVGILLLMLSPVYTVYEDFRQRQSCLNNLKHIWRGLEMYRVDYSGCLPFSDDSTSLLWDGTRGEKVSLGKLYPGYVLTLSVFYCPSQKVLREASPEYGLANHGVAGRFCYGSYYARGSRQFSDAANLETACNPDGYPDKTAWVSDYTMDATRAAAHHGHGVQVLSSTGRIYFVNGHFTCSGPADTGGTLFWRAMDLAIPRPTPAATPAAAQPETDAVHAETPI